MSIGFFENFDTKKEIMESFISTVRRRRRLDLLILVTTLFYTGFLQKPITRLTLTLSWRSHQHSGGLLHRRETERNE